MSINTFSPITKADSTKMNANFTKVLGALVTGEDKTGGTSATISLAYKFKPLSLRVFVSGVRLRKAAGATGYTETYDGSGDGISLTLGTAPIITTPVVVDYQKANIDL